VQKWRLTIGIVALATLTAVVSVLASGASAQKQQTQQKKLTFGFVVHVLGNPFIQQIIDGAMAAGRDLGVTVKVAGPNNGDANVMLKDIQDFFGAGADGVATSCQSESLVKPLNQVIASGKPVASFNITCHDLNAPYVGERSVNSGRILGGLVGQKLGGQRATGKVVTGICFPGIPVLTNRNKGVVQGLKRAAPKLTVKGPFDVKVAQTDNFAHWQQLYAANHDATAFVGLCAPDVTSLGKLNSQIGDKLVAGGYDTTSANLAAIKAGHAYVTLGQNPFVQGYLPILMMYDAVTKHRKLPKGFVESGTEIVDAGGATEPYNLGHISFKQVEALAKSPAKTAVFYGRLFKGPNAPLKNWRKAMEPLANEGK
jgi:ABC-type sugar transport system substrate-binding protein